jgi:hypothetical protein
VVVGMRGFRDSKNRLMREVERESNPRHDNRGRSSAQPATLPLHILNRGCQFPKC